MEFDQSYAGAIDWNFPSPTATPRTSTYVHNSLQTPKTIPFPTHFQDAFRTPQVGNFTTPQLHSFQNTTPAPRPQVSSEVLQSNYYAQTERNMMQAGQPQAIQMVHHARSMEMPHIQAHLQNGMSDMSASFYDSSQMQTPPPTRGSTGKKQPTHTPRRSLDTPSTIASRRMTTIQDQPQHIQPGHVQPAQQHAVQFPQFQMPTSGSFFDNLGPATAPVLGHSQNLWEQPTTSVPHHPAGLLDDPFAPAGLHVQRPSQPTMLDAGAMRAFPGQLPHARSASNLPFASSFSAEPSLVSGSVDPSLVYSSPARPLNRSSSFGLNPLQEVAGTLKRKDSSASLRSEVVSNETDETNPTGPGLRRSQTLGSLRSKSNALIASLELSNRSNSIKDVPRTASPLKKNGKPSLSSIFEDKPHAKPAIVLTVDENGLARTEARSDITKGPAATLRERYPGLYDSDSSDDEDDSDQSEPAASRAASFSLMKTDDRKSKSARLDSTVENMEGLSILRSASAASLRKAVTPSRAALAAAAQLRRSGSLRRPASGRSLRRRRSVLANGSISVDSGPLTLPTDSTAHSLLRPRTTAPETVSPSSTDSDSQLSWLGDHHTAPFDQTLAPAVNFSVQESPNKPDARWQGVSFDQPAHSFQAWSFQAPGPAEIMQHQHSSTQILAQGAPTTMNPLIQCLCGVSDDTSQPLVQCTMCASWHHSFCVGPHVQATFTCAFCTRPSTNMMMVQAPTGWA